MPTIIAEKTAVRSIEKVIVGAVSLPRSQRLAVAQEVLETAAEQPVGKVIVSAVSLPRSQRLAVAQEVLETAAKQPVGKVIVSAVSLPRSQRRERDFAATNWGSPTNCQDGDQD